MLKRLALAAAALLTLASAPAIAASCSGTGCYIMKDGLLNPQSVKATTLGDGTIVPMSTPVDATGTPFGSGNPSFTQLVGSSVGVTTLPALPAGTNTIGNVGLTGSLPSFATTPTVNLGTLNGAATATLQQSMITALGSPLQAGGTVVLGGGTATVGTVNLGTLNGAATAAAQATSNAALGTTADTAPANPTVAGTIVAKLSGIWQALITRLPLDTNGNLKIAMFDQNGANVTYGGTTSVSQAGTVGSDSSVNQPAIPNVGATFGSTGPYANYVLVKTIAAGARNNVDVENTSGAQVLIVRDDGTATSGSAPANASLIPLGPGSAAGQQGGSWVSATFKGRLQIYAPTSSAFVTAFVD